jgi:hypothetical protein
VWVSLSFLAIIFGLSHFGPCCLLILFFSLAVYSVPDTQQSPHRSMALKLGGGVEAMFGGDGDKILKRLHLSSLAFYCYSSTYGPSQLLRNLSEV